MTGFATYTDLGTRLKRVFIGDEQAWIDELLEDASEHLRTVIGQEVYPQRTVTFEGWPAGGRVDLPQAPVVSIELVARAGEPIPYQRGPGYVEVDGKDPVDITYWFGTAAPPRELTRLACVLVSQTLLPLEQELGLTAGGLSSVQLDDFKLAFANAGELSGMALTKHATASIQKQFGREGVAIVEASS